MVQKYPFSKSKKKSFYRVRFHNKQIDDSVNFGFLITNKKPMNIQENLHLVVDLFDPATFDIFDLQLTSL